LRSLRPEGALSGFGQPGATEVKRLAALLLLAFLAACAHRAGPGTADEVMQADRDFAARAAAVGIQAAFVEYAAPDAMLLRAGVGPIRGRQAIGESFAGTEKANLAWAPEAAETAASGELAYTWGWYTLSADGKTSTGNYVSIWRRIDGHWRYVIDLGVPAPRP